jgi:hypothetical protein
MPSHWVFFPVTSRPFNKTVSQAAETEKAVSAVNSGDPREKTFTIRQQNTILVRNSYDLKIIRECQEVKNADKIKHSLKKSDDRTAQTF